MLSSVVGTHMKADRKGERHKTASSHNATLKRNTSQQTMRKIFSFLAPKTSGLWPGFDGAHRTSVSSVSHLFSSNSCTLSASWISAVLHNRATQPPFSSLLLPSFPLGRGSHSVHLFLIYLRARSKSLRLPRNSKYPALNTPAAPRVNLRSMIGSTCSPKVS